MDLGIHGRRALVCASSQGLGYACAQALAEEGCSVWLNGRSADRLQAAHMEALVYTFLASRLGLDTK